MNALRRSLLALVLLAAGCDLLDFTDVENPNVTENDFLNFPDPMASWLRGMERQMALALNNQNLDVESSYLATAELASDNYINTATFFNQFMDGLTIDYADDDIEIALREFADLRETAEFGLERVVAADPSTTDDQRAELWFFKGMAHLYTGEVWHLAPADSGGPPVPSVEQIQMAQAAFEQALELTSDAQRAIGYRIALARAHRALGDRAGAREYAEAAIAADPDYTRFAAYDFVNGPENDMQLALFGRPQNDLQPLPRLDFLDPKFFNSAEPNNVDDQYADVAFIKGEEAFLILAEVQLAEGDLAGAQATLRDLLNVVAGRRVRPLVDTDDPRVNVDGSPRPKSADWRVAAAPGAPLRDGFVLERSGEISLPVISGTSVTAEQIDALAGLDEALELLYLMRQEIFIAEGRRMIDLGIKWPVPLAEVLVNENIADGDPATQPVIPPFLPAGEMDAFVMDEEARTVTILHDLNQILVENRASEFVLPFH